MHSNSFFRYLLHKMKKYLLLLLFLFQVIQAEEPFPAAYKGRFRPFDVVQKLGVEDPLLLPNRLKPGEWLPLSELSKSEHNFTPYSDKSYANLRKLYLTNKMSKVKTLLSKNYQTIAGKPYLQSAQKTLYYPTVNQLKAEIFYYDYPFIRCILLGYILAVVLFLFQEAYNSRILSLMAWSVTSITFGLHTLVLLLRIYILQRPPVSNMFETVIYVPWIGSIIGIALSRYFKILLPVILSSCLAAVLMTLLEITQINSSLENVQPVLDSQYWLTIHVLMIVASYGVLLLCGLLGHAYLISPSPLKCKLILQTMYIGVALLIPGTILGGVWAAQSWGRFWDWDPKESWAFISSALYLVSIHAYRYHKIAEKGLAIGSIIGLLAISFTWYGVNYILGTGLHSYGFGSGGEIYYYLFVSFELLFISYFLLKKALTDTSTSN